ncbi:unannotated protein [freshwater metagenome]|uniref:non-specific protein-tyrosine kinase n=1 Tax=freshwater metagenome TaxID=449393 RepID=A0A6J7XV39_9ZZZZ|nr:polysaccharide biosynthesis tyrosine autokinase [Actinomycetota bacterium]
MDLQDYYRLIRRNLGLILVFVILGVGTSTIVTFLQTPMYEAEVQLFVSTPASSVDISALAQGSSFSQQRVKSYAQIINGPQTLNSVISQLKLDISAQELAKKVKASAPLDTVLINVIVTDPNPELVADIANAVGFQFAKTVNNLELGTSGDTASAIKLSVVKNAIVPTTPSSPKKTLNLLLGLILGFGLGLGISILRVIFDNTVKNANDLDETPLLAVIAFDKEAITHPLISQISKWSARTESFRHLRTSLQYLKAENPPQVISVTSAFPNEGKTTTSVNLALSLVLSGHATLLVEADLRRPKLLSYLGAKSDSPGLSELLSGKLSMSEEENVRSAISTMPNTGLDFMASGHLPPNPTELLDSQSFQSLLTQLRGMYDFIIVDSPPALLVSDAQVISTNVDGTLIVIHAGQTRKNQYLGTRESIQAVGGTILGAVLNMVPETTLQGDYGYKYSGGEPGRYGYRKYGYGGNNNSTHNTYPGRENS